MTCRQIASYEIKAPPIKIISQTRKMVIRLMLAVGFIAGMLCWANGVRYWHCHIPINRLPRSNDGEPMIGHYYNEKDKLRIANMAKCRSFMILGKSFKILSRKNFAIFLKPERITFLWIVSGWLSDIERDGLPFPNIVELRLGRNKLTIIKKSYFGYAKALETLDLYENPITKIEDEAFDHFQNLRTLNLFGTKLKSIMYDYKSVPYTQVISKTLCRLHLQLTATKIEKEIHLENCVSVTNCWKNPKCPSSTISVGYSLESFPPLIATNIFVVQNKIKSLQQDQLTTLQEKGKNWLTKIKNIYISGNSMVCDKCETFNTIIKNDILVWRDAQDKEQSPCAEPESARLLMINELKRLTCNEGVLTIPAKPSNSETQAVSYVLLLTSLAFCH